MARGVGFVVVTNVGETPVLLKATRVTAAKLTPYDYELAPGERMGFDRVSFSADTVEIVRRDGARVEVRAK